MLGSNPSADSGAKTEGRGGVVFAAPLQLLRDWQQSDKPILLSKLPAPTARSCENNFMLYAAQP